MWENSRIADTLTLGSGGASRWFLARDSNCCYLLSMETSGSNYFTAQPIKKKLKFNSINLSALLSIYFIKYNDKNS